VSDSIAAGSGLDRGGRQNGPNVALEWVSFAVELSSTADDRRIDDADFEPGSTAVDLSSMIYFVLP
jgi:hypothetical protein